MDFTPLTSLISVPLPPQNIQTIPMQPLFPRLLFTLLIAVTLKTTQTQNNNNCDPFVSIVVCPRACYAHLPTQSIRVVRSFIMVYYQWYCIGAWLATLETTPNQPGTKCIFVACNHADSI